MFIALEGGEGSGKSTQARLLANALHDAGRPVILTREPGGTDLGRHIRTLLLDGTAPSPRAEALLYAADRAHHVDTVIRPALNRGETVITDRYIDSSLAYQGAGRSLWAAGIRRLSDWAADGLYPDLTILLDIDPAAGLPRATRTGSDRIERETLDFHQRVRHGFLLLARADPGRYLIIDATLPPNQIAALVQDGLLTARPSCTGRAPTPARRSAPSP